jgi:hypothetical protein
VFTSMIMASPGTLNPSRTSDVAIGARDGHRLYLIDRRALVCLCEICALDDESSIGGLAAQVR